MEIFTGDGLLGAGVTLAGAIVAGLGVFFVYRQLSLLRQQIKLQNFAEYTKRYQEIMNHLPERVFFDPFDFPQGQDEKDTLMHWFRAYYDMCFEEWYLHQAGVISDDFWQIWHGGMRTAVNRSAFRQAWTVVRDSSEYGEDFETFIAGLQKPETAPAAAPAAAKGQQ